jgi:competence ComEA-like helix-hairpin-helix protein
MPTAAERQALLFLLGITLLGGGARLWTLAPPGAAPPSALPTPPLQRQRAAVDSARSARRDASRGDQARRGAPRRGTPSAPVAINRATVAELERLPRVGPALARRIVAHREAQGPFASLEALGEVPGIGPATLRLLAPFVTFSPAPRPFPAGETGWVPPSSR